MYPAHLSPDCERFRNDLCAHLYQELAPAARAALEQHLGICAACRDELVALGETQKLLGRWETPAGGEDPRRLAREIAARAGLARRTRGRLVRLTALVSGAAAALLCALCLFNTEVELEGGHLRLSFALPGAATRPSVSPAPVSADGSADWEEQMRAIAAHEVSTHAASLQSQEQLFQRCSLMTQDELLRLSQAVDLALAESQRAVNTRLATLKRESDVNDLAQRQAITDLAAYIRPISNPKR